MFALQTSSTTLSSDKRCLPPQEMSGIVYTTVDFRAHQKPTEVHANLRKHTTQAEAPDPTWSTEHDGMVEYSTLAIHQ